MTNSGYVVYCRWHVCGRLHLFIGQLPLPGDPTEPCTLTDVYPDGNLVSDLLWCHQTGETIERGDCARIHLTLRPPDPPSERLTRPDRF